MKIVYMHVITYAAHIISSPSLLLWILDETSAPKKLKKSLEPFAISTSSVNVPYEVINFDNVSDLCFDNQSKSFKALHIFLGLRSFLQKKFLYKHHLALLNSSQDSL